jgi:capsular polysaccharide biosynthesis protein
MESKLEFKEILEKIRKRIKIIILTTLIFLITSTIVSFYIIKPTYKSDTTLIISKSQANVEDTISSDELNVTKNLAITYGKIIKSRVVLNKVIESLSLNYTYDELYRNVEVQPIEETQIIKISVEDRNPKIARDIANSIPNIFMKEAQRLTNTNKVEVIDKAIINKEPIKPNKLISIVIGTMFGFFIGILITFLIEYLDTKIKNKADVEKYLDIHVLGVIPKDKKLK